MADKGTLAQILAALTRTPSGATQADFQQALTPERYAVPMDRRPATIRAPSYGERLQEVVERLAGTVQAQPVGRLLDALLGGGIGDTAEGVSPPLMRWGQMPDGPTKAGREALAREVAERVRVPNPIKAYHGSPHEFGVVGGQGRDAGGFDFSKIGTGEGAQAYGHGGYFAQAEPVAKGYRDNLTKSGVEGARKRLAESGGDIDAAIATASDKVKRYRAGGAGGYADAIEEDLLALQKFKREGEWNKGRMYEVAIHADPESFLDWDKPLSQQSEKVRQALRHESIPTVRSMLGGMRGRSYIEPDVAPYFTASDLVQSWPTSGAADASETLRRAGIPGIKYLDQASRSAGDGSRNYVVFDDALVEILRKYGLLPFAAGLTPRNDQ